MGASAALARSKLDALHEAILSAPSDDARSALLEAGWLALVAGYAAAARTLWQLRVGRGAFAVSPRAQESTRLALAQLAHATGEHAAVEVIEADQDGRRVLHSGTRLHSDPALPLPPVDPWNPQVARRIRAVLGHVRHLLSVDDVVNARAIANALLDAPYAANPPSNTLWNVRLLMTDTEIRSGHLAAGAQHLRVLAESDLPRLLDVTTMQLWLRLTTLARALADGALRDLLAIDPRLIDGLVRDAIARDSRTIDTPAAPTVDWHGIIERCSGALDAMGYDVEPPAAPATPEAIRTAEFRLGMALPASFRTFLSVANGWPEFEACIPLPRSIEEIGFFRDEDPDWIAAWCDGFGEPTPVPDEEYFVYGAEQESSTMRPELLSEAIKISPSGEEGVLLLVPSIRTPEGEYEAWYFANHLAGAIRYRSFADLMEGMVRLLER